MKFKEIVAPSMKELFIKTIENMILSGELKIGEKLPTERELASQMKISRTIVNLGLNELKQKGFVEINARKGTVVGDYIKNGNTDILLSIINYNGDKLDKQTFYSLTHFKVMNEAEGTYLAAINRTEKDLAEIKSLRDKLHNAKDIDEFSTLSFDFHHAIFCASGNIVYPLVHNSFKNISIKLASILYKNAPSESSNHYFDTITDAIERKDSTQARSEMIDLIRHTVDMLAPIYFSDYESDKHKFANYKH